MKKRIRRWSSDDLNRIIQLKQYILNSLEMPLHLSSLAVMAQMNEKKLNEIFLYLYHLKPALFIRQQRMQKAHDLLLHTDKAIKEINKLCGYPDLSSFHRAFLQFYGYTPASLRNL